MKRLGRILLNTLTAISLLLAVATGVLWVRSVSRYEGIWLYGTFGQLGVTSGGPGYGLRLGYNDRFYSSSNQTRWSAQSNQVSAGFPRDTWWQRRGFSLFTNHRGTSRRSILVGVPHVLPLMVFAVAPALWIRQRRREGSAQKAGLCPACGYDMRANPMRCSECGRLGAENSMAGDGGDVR